MNNKELIEYFEKKYGKKLSEFTLNGWIHISESTNPYLTEDFMREFEYTIDWLAVCINQKLSESFIREFKEKVWWGTITIYQKLSEEIIREFKGRVDWGFIFTKQKLSGEFIEEFKHKVDTRFISKHNKINWLKYKMKSGKISNEEYLKELLICQSQTKN